MSANISRPDVVIRAANEISDVPAQDTSDSTSSEASLDAAADRDKELMTLTVGKFLKRITAEWLAAAADPGSDIAMDLSAADVDRSLVTALLDHTNKQIYRTNQLRQDPYKPLPWQTTLTATQVKLASQALGRELDPEVVMEIQAKFPAPEDDVPEMPQGEPDGAAKNVRADDALNYFLAMYEVFMGDDGVAYAAPRGDKKLRVARPVMDMGGPLRVMMRQIFHKVVTKEVISNALATADAMAADQPVRRVCLRSSDEGDRIVIDLGRNTGELVAITASGWEVLRPENGDVVPDTTWVRTAATLPLPIPERGGHRDMLGDLEWLTPDDPSRKLAWGWAVGAYFPDIPRPALWMVGTMGSAKSSRARHVIGLIDPTPELGSTPASEKDSNVVVFSRYVASFDNIGKINEAYSDWLCRVVTGFLNERRTLFTTDQITISAIKRALIATSLEVPVGLKPDAIERLLPIFLERIPDEKRRTERQLKEAYEKIHARLLGALYDDIAGVLAHREEVEALVASGSLPVPRMADYAVVLHALDMHLDQFGDDDGFAGTYVTAVHSSMADRAMDDSLTTAMMKLVPTIGDMWDGTATDLFNALEQYRPSNDKEAWPTSARSLGGALTRQQELFRAAGLLVKRDRRKVGGKVERYITITNATPLADPDVGNDPALVALLDEARREADGFTAHQAILDQGLKTAAGVVDDGKGGFIIRLGATPDRALWDEAAQTYNGSPARPWLSISAKFRG